MVSINRSGQPNQFDTPFSTEGNLEWVKGDAMNGSTYREKIMDADGAISCVGAFGSNAFMEKVNGDTNINAISEALKAGTHIELL